MIEHMNTQEWYVNLTKPAFAPPTYLFGVVWSIIYPIIFLSYGYTIYLVQKDQIPKSVLFPLFINLFFNFAFSPIQFGLKNNLLAALDIVLVLATTIWFMWLVYPHSKAVALSQVPYALWVIFATILQFSITYLNW